MPLDDVTPSLLDRYLTGECSSAEAEQVRRWLSEHPVYSADFDLLREVREVAARTPVWDVRGSWQRVQLEMTTDEVSPVAGTISRDRRIGDHPVSSPLSGFRRVQASRMERLAKIPCGVWYPLVGFAAVALALLLGWGVKGTLMSHRITMPAATYVTAKGQRAAITLPDGSQVLLNVASRLDVPADYERGDHALRLTGEASFTVTHHDATPFTVSAGGSTTRVLGTNFVVRHYPADSVTMVAVHDGRVAVRSTVVSSMQEVVVGQRGVGQVEIASPSEFGFVNGVLTLKAVPLAEAVEELDRWYNADVRLGDSALEQRQVTGEFTAGSLTDLAAILELMFDVRVVRDGKVLTLYPRG